jgi:hypothetical protein
VFTTLEYRDPPLALLLLLMLLALRLSHFVKIKSAADRKSGWYIKHIVKLQSGNSFPISGDLGIGSFS